MSSLGRRATKLQDPASSCYGAISPLSWHSPKGMSGAYWTGGPSADRVERFLRCGKAKNNGATAV